VSHNASLDEIKKKFREKSLECHPDKFPDDKRKEDQFKAISEAYQTLSDKTLRQKYNNTLNISSRPRSNSGYTYTTHPTTQPQARKTQTTLINHLTETRIITEQHKGGKLTRNPPFQRNRDTLMKNTLNKLINQTLARITIIGISRLIEITGIIKRRRQMNRVIEKDQLVSLVTQLGRERVQQHKTTNRINFTALKRTPLLMMVRTPEIKILGRRRVPEVNLSEIPNKQQIRPAKKTPPNTPKTSKTTITTTHLP